MCDDELVDVIPSMRAQIFGPSTAFRLGPIFEELVVSIAKDIDLAVLSLGRDNWKPQTGVQKMESARSKRSFADIALEARSQLQRGIDNVPLHKFGVRTEGARLKDEVRGVGGVYIRR